MPTVGGGAVGLIGAGAASRLVQNALFGIEALDPTTYLSVFAFIVSVAALSAWMPGRRAASVDPMIVLKNE